MGAIWCGRQEKYNHKFQLGSSSTRAGRCTFKIGIIEQPIALTPSGQLYVATYSGSEREIALYDLRTCRVHWQSGEFAGKLELTSSALQMGEKTFKLDAQCVPVRRATIAKP